jgi:hypothetical protein
MITTAKQI